MPVKRPSEAADRAAFSGVVRLSDGQWRAIVAAAAPYKPEATARAELEQALADYRGYAALNPNKLKTERKRAQRIVKLARKLEAELQAQQDALSIRPWRKGRRRIEEVEPEPESIAKVRSLAAQKPRRLCRGTRGARQSKPSVPGIPRY